MLCTKLIKLNYGLRTMHNGPQLRCREKLHLLQQLVSLV